MLNGFPKHNQNKSKQNTITNENKFQKNQKDGKGVNSQKNL